MNKNLIGILSMSMLLMSACGQEASDTTNTVETEEQSSEGNTEDISSNNEADSIVDSSEDVIDDDNEDSTENDSIDDSTEQVGDVIEDEGGKRIVTGTNYGINETQTSGPFEITVINAQAGQLEVSDPDMIEFLGDESLATVSIEIEVTNNSDNTNTFYPDQSIIVTDQGNQVNSDILLSDKVGGDFYGQVTKHGSVAFTYDGNAEDINRIRYIIDAPHDENFDSIGEDLEFSIDF